MRKQVRSIYATGELPSESSLKQFTGSRLQSPGMNDEYIYDQSQLYQKLKVEQSSKGLSVPLGEGILVFDEVRVISKVMWNSSNNKLQGIAMQRSDYAQLTDIYDNLKNDNEAPTDYVLQWFWRNVSYRFDVMGPYITSSGPVKKEDLVGYLYDVIQLFEMNDFHIRAIVCDGASTNLSCIKHLLHVKGPFGFQLDNEGKRNYDISPSFLNPFYPGRSIHAIICPSHQLKNTISALHSSKPQGQGKKSFELRNVAFGWKPKEEVYNEEIARFKRGEARRVKGLMKSYVERDSWTRLNVKPAKIMQQEDMLTALHATAFPHNKPASGHADEIITTREYLRHTKMIFEDGILCNNQAIDSLNHPLLLSILDGYNFFVDWLDDVLDSDKEYNPNSPCQKKFLSWQTWDLMRVMVFGFVGFAKDFLTEFPGYFILPVKINGSSIESVFGQMRYSTAGKLTGVNYAHAQRNLLLKKDVHGQRVTHDDYRGAAISVAEFDLKRKSSKKLNKSV